MGKKLTAVLAALAIILCLVPTDLKASAADEGVWVLVDQYFEVKEPVNDYGCKFFLKKYEYDSATYTASYEKEAQLENADGVFNCTFYATCKALTPTVKAGENMQFEVKTWVSGNTLDNMMYSNSIYLTEGEYAIYFRDKDEYSHYWLKSETGVDYKESDSAIVEREMGSGKEYGEKYTVKAEQQSGNADSGIIKSFFVYEWKAPAPAIAAPGKVTIKSASAGDGKVTVKIKKIAKNCKGYEFEIATKKDFSDAKVYVVNKNKTVKKVISGLKEDVIYYIRVRAFNSKDGQNAYGAYSKVKKIVL
ncbi:MAG: hypothetical protein J6Y89_04645 [Lachnospiraceae bacterium]|nr:hypothetical protein [Lachnospiraceae bacterium]